MQTMHPKAGSREKGPLAPTFGGFKFGGDRGRHYTPWLVVRADSADSGARPLAGGTVFWESPDVWAVSSIGVNQPVPGQANSVFARVTNLGLQEATGVQVKFWWANPSIAITESSAHLIGIGSASIPSGWSVTVPCPKPWFPVEENNGHECLLAEAAIPNFDPLTSPMDPVDDRHVGQKNEQLIMVANGASFRVSLSAVNAAPFAQPITIEVHPVVSAELSPLVTARRLGLPVALKAPQAALPLGIAWHDAPPVFVGPSAVFARRLLSMTLDDVAGRGRTCLAAPQVTHEATFGPWESRTVEVTGRIPADAEPGQTFAFRVSQRSGRMVQGGYTVHAVVAEG